MKTEKEMEKPLSGFSNTFHDEKFFSPPFREIFFSMCFSFSLGIYESLESRARERLIPTPLYQFHPLHEYLDISQAITADISSAKNQRPELNQEALVSVH